MEYAQYGFCKQTSVYLKDGPNYNIIFIEENSLVFFFILEKSVFSFILFSVIHSLPHCLNHFRAFSSCVFCCLKVNLFLYVLFGVAL